MNPRTPLLWAGCLGATGVAMGAFGAHGLKAALTASGMLETWKTAAHYQIVHAVALLALASLARSTAPTPSPRLAWATRLFAAGTLLFSGSLYALCLGGPSWLGPVTPLGGLCLIVGWGFTAFAAF